MKELFQNKFLMGVAVIFWISLFLVVSMQAKVEARDQESFETEVSYVLK